MRPTIPTVDFNGDGSTSEPLPGLNYKSRSLSKSDLSRLVDQYNQQYAGKTTVRNQAIPRVTLPANYSFGDNSFTQDVRLTKNFNIDERFKISVFGEVFNLFNIANLGGYNFSLTSAQFGQPTVRTNQVFGSGGPRAFQFGARVSF